MSDYQEMVPAADKFNKIIQHSKDCVIFCDCDLWLYNYPCILCVKIEILKYQTGKKKKKFFLNDPKIICRDENAFLDFRQLVCMCDSD